MLPKEGGGFRATSHIKIRAGIWMTVHHQASRNSSMIYIRGVVSTTLGSVIMIGRQGIAAPEA